MLVQADVIDETVNFIRRYLEAHTPGARDQRRRSLARLARGRRLRRRRRLGRLAADVELQAIADTEAMATHAWPC